MPDLTASWVYSVCVLTSPSCHRQCVLGVTCRRHVCIVGAPWVRLVCGLYASCVWLTDGAGCSALDLPEPLFHRPGGYRPEAYVMAAAKDSTILKVPPTCGLGDCRGAPAIRPGAWLANSPSGLPWRESDPMYGSWVRRACILCVLWVRGVCVLGAQ